MTTQHKPILPVRGCIISLLGLLYKYHRPDALKQQESLSHSSGSWKSEVNVLAGPHSL